jgi:hypothetical protein
MFLAALALAPAAQAAQRYAAPAGTGAECTQAKPCSLKEAITKAKANDEVIVTSGAYTVTETVFLAPEASGAYVHGDFGGPRPTITGAVSGSYLIGAYSPNVRISYLDVTNSGNFSGGLYCGPGVVAERLRLSGKGQLSYGLQLYGTCAAHDSVMHAEGESSTAVIVAGDTGLTGILRNLTAFATGPKSNGLRVNNISLSAGNYQMVVRNSILSGEEFDLYAASGFFGGTTTVDVSHSNFETSKADPGTVIAAGAANQTAAPLFVDAGAGDYREAAGSPTIDAGVADQLGPSDFDGNPRTLGSAPDIGAYEFVPPPVVPPAPGQIQSLSLAPRGFRAVNAGEAIFSARKKRKVPIGTTVTYSLSAAGTIEFSVERRLPGRKVGKRCLKPTKANRTKKKCSRFKPVKGSFAHSGQTGQNRFKFSGRIAGKGLKPGGYRLVGKTGSASKTASFKIVK